MSKPTVTNNDLWKEYKTEDPRIIRPIDGNEFFVANSYINITDVFPKISTEEFKKRAEENLSKLAVFNLAFKQINGHLFFIQRPFKSHLKEIEYTEDEEIENYLKKDEENIIPYDPVRENDDKDVQSIFHFKICQLEKSNQTKITFSVSHAVADGRTAFYMMDNIRKIVNGESLEKNDEQLTSFGGLERFKNLDESFYKIPEVWNEIPEMPMNPKIPPPYSYVMPHMIFDYEPVSKFNRENGITVQAMLMAMLTRATRRYKNLPKETPLWNATACNAKSSPYATEEFKNRQYYCNIGNIFVKVVGQSSLMEDLKHCMAQLKEAKKSNDEIRQLVCCSSIVDPKTLQFIPKGRFPDPNFQAVVNSTNIGKVNGNMPLLTISNPPFFYTFFVHSYHTEDKLFVSLIRPVNFDKTYIDYVMEEMNKIFIPENISKY